MSPVNKKKWIYPRHKFIRFLVYPIFALFCKIKFGLKCERLNTRKRPYLILCNHQTKEDQYLIYTAVQSHVYFVATEDIFSNGFLSSVLRYLCAPIPFMKSTADMRSVMDMLQVAREGGSIAIFPEGNRTYSGKTCNMKPSIAHLAQKIGLPVAILNITNGYGVHPRWSDKKRKGNVNVIVKRIIEPEEYKGLSQQEFFEIIDKELEVNEASDGLSFPSKRNAEFMERVFYYCPKCGISSFHSEKKHIYCQKCNLDLIYNDNKTITSSDSFFPFKNTVEWYDAQEEFIRSLDLSVYKENEPVFTDKVLVKKVIPYVNKTVISSNSVLSLYTDRLTLSECEPSSFDFDSVYAMSVLDNNKLNIYIDKQIYQIVGDIRFNALKYVNLFYHSHNKGDHHDEFLGL